jgi:hypothetical protein
MKLSNAPLGATADAISVASPILFPLCRLRLFRQVSSSRTFQSITFARRFPARIVVATRAVDTGPSRRRRTTASDISVAEIGCQFLIQRVQAAIWIHPPSAQQQMTIAGATGDQEYRRCERNDLD